MNKFLKKDFLGYNKIFVMGSFLIPFVYTLFWLLKNTQLPENDASNYLMTSINIYHHFLDKHFISSIMSFYTERGWRPIFFPVLTVPFLLISKGHLYFSYVCVSIGLLFATTTYLYYFFRLKLDQLSSLVCASIIALLPLVQAQLIMFYAEGALFPCVIGALYHLIASDFLRIKKHTIGFIILTSFAFLFRPIEALTDFLFIFIAFYSIGLYRDIFKFSDLAKIVLFYSIVLFCFFTFVSYRFIHFTPIHLIDGGPVDLKMAKVVSLGLLASLVFFTGIGIVFYRQWVLSRFNIFSFKNNKLEECTFLVPAFSWIGIVILLWYLPFAFQTFEWVYRTSMGDVAASTGSLSGALLSWPLLSIYLHTEGLFIVVSSFVLMIIGMILQSRKERKEIIFSLPIIYLLLILPFPFWESFCTVQIVTRKLAVAFPALLMAMLFIGLYKGRLLSVRIGLASVILVSQWVLMFLVMNNSSPRTPDSLLHDTIGYFVPKPVIVQPNPHDVILNFLLEESKRYKLHSFGIEVNPGTPDARHFLESEPIDPFLLSTMMAALHSSYSASYPYFGVYNQMNSIILTQQYDAILLSDSADEMMVSSKAYKNYLTKFNNESNSSLKTFYLFLMHFSNNTLNKIGWVKGPCMTVKSVDHGNYLACLLLPKKNKP